MHPLIRSTAMSDTAAPRLAGVELGGTKAIVVLGQGTKIVERVRIATTDAEGTLAAIRRQLERWNNLGPIAALGIASFGPIGITPGRADYGQMLLTPKPSWTGADVLGELKGGIAATTEIELDVNAAALAEGRMGAARGCRDHAYMTVGTGIGVGIVSGGRLVRGQMHPEAGHMRVRRLEEDHFAGSCEYHGDCLAGLASGPALRARAGADGATIPADHSLWPFVVDALAEACAVLIMTLSCERIVLGGGIIVKRPELIDRIAIACAAKIKGFPPVIGDRAPIFGAKLGEDAGPIGSLIIAGRAIR